MIPTRRGRLRINLRRPPTLEDVALTKARAIMAEWTWGPMRDHFQSPQDERWFVANEGFRDHRPEPLDHDTATRVARHLNELFHRIVYLMDKPDTALTIGDEGPRLTRTDIDHETLFRLGRR